MPPRTRCPDGKQCRNYSISISSSPDMDGCFGECERIPDSEIEQLRAQLAETEEAAKSAQHDLLLSTERETILNQRLIETEAKLAEVRKGAVEIQKQQKGAPVPLDAVLSAIKAVDAEAASRGQYYPQTHDEQMEDRAAIKRVLGMIEWYVKHGGVNGWPSISTPPAEAGCVVPEGWNGKLIRAAERYAEKYAGDDRQDIITDVLNAFYAGSKFALKPNASAPEPPK